MWSVDSGYRLITRGARLVSPLLASGGSKLARGIRGRRSAVPRLVEWGRLRRDSRRPTIWLHAPSVGEGLQARAVLDAVRVRRPEVQCVFTHFSPSAEEWARGMPADVVAYLPWDVPADVDAVLDAVEPDLIVFTKTEVWPTLVERAHRRGVATALMAGTVPPGARRDRPLARVLLAPTWERLELACAVAEPDALRLQAWGVPAGRVEVTGDPGIDSAAQRVRAVDPRAPWIGPLNAFPAPTVVAGSTWPADEAVLLPALRAVRGVVPGVRIVVAPHEPRREPVDRLTERLNGEGWVAGTLARVESAGSLGSMNAVVVERVGVLAHLYSVGSVAYVGGGFHARGLHSVLEPAAARLPVLFGPRHRNTRAAIELVGCGGARVVSGSADLASALHHWLEDDVARVYAAGRAFSYIDAHLGAAERTAALLLDLLDQETRAPAP